MTTLLIHVVYLVLYVCVIQCMTSQPNIVMVLVDDYGWYDIGFHGGEVHTPTMDKLAEEGVRLENYYVQPICTPTRSQLLSGRYQIHTGLQHDVLSSGQDNGLPTDIPTVADLLKQRGYATHIVGKWHIGYSRQAYLPTHRGFDSFYGYLAGHEDYYNHTKCGGLPVLGLRCGLDFWENEKPLPSADGKYSTHLYTSRAQSVIRDHAANRTNQPLFLYLPYQAVHDPCEVPEKYEEPYSYMPKGNRRTYLGMVTALDEAIKNVTDTLKQTGMWNNTVLVLSTDNGGDYRGNEGYNWPLRGRKWTLWEGGMRGNAFVASPLIKKKGRISWDLLHVSDWLPTFVSLAGGNVSGLALDGFNVWNTISESSPSPRKELLHNIDPLQSKKGSSLYNGTFDTRVRAAIRYGDWKLITGDPGDGQWMPPPHLASANQSLVDDSLADDKNVWLFNIRNDPVEINDLSQQNTAMVKQLLQRLQYYNSTAVKCRFPAPDPRDDPNKHGGIWGPWL